MATEENLTGTTAVNAPDDGGQIKVLKGLEAVRKRPGMYIGDTDDAGLHQLVYEVVDNSIDEALAGYCQHIEVTIGLDNSITVVDDGRGIPVGMHPTENRPACEVALTMLHAGGKFDKDVYKFSGGLHGVGVSCVNALSSWLKLTVDKDGYRYEMRFSRGVTTEPLKQIGPSNRRGTTVQYLPDDEVFSVTEYKWDILAKRLRELAYLNAGISITLTDVRGTDPRSETFKYEGGVSEFVKYLNDGKNVLSPSVITIAGETQGFRSDGSGDFFYDIALQLNDSYDESIHSFVNGINTKDGGTHLTGFLTALTRAINNYSKKMTEDAAKKSAKKGAAAAKKSSAAKEITVSSEDVRKGLAVVVSVKVENPLFESQTKTKLNNPEVNGLMQTATYGALMAYFEEHPQEAADIVNHAIISAKAREKARQAIEDVMNPQKALAGLTGKLSDCSSKDPRLCELYIVEGDSAGGSAKNGRESAFQAILPIRGKLINAEKAAPDRLLRNEEIRTLFTAIGCGAGDEIDVSKARYHRIVIMTDADVDGSHIRTLVLTFLFRHLKPLVEAGYVYIARPPLFKVTKGKEERYVETEDAMNSTLTQLGLKSLSLRLPGNTENLPPEQVGQIIQEIRDCLRFCNTNLPRYGIRATDFLKLRLEHGTFPQYMLEIREEGVTGTSYAWSREEADAISAEAAARIDARRAAAAAAAGVADATAAEDALEATAAAEEPEKDAEVQVDEEGNVIAMEAAQEKPREDINVVKLPEAQALDNLAAALASQGLDIQTIFQNEAPVAELVDSKSGVVTPVTSLQELCDAVTAQGRKGLKIQRYKGLGEMSADELWETTMNPETRSMIQVKVDDAEQADKTFDLLMGSNVLPRREFIESNADKVLNPDI